MLSWISYWSGYRRPTRIRGSDSKSCPRSMILIWILISSLSLSLCVCVCVCLFSNLFSLTFFHSNMLTQSNMAMALHLPSPTPVPKRSRASTSTTCPLFPATERTAGIQSQSLLLSPHLPLSHAIAGGAEEWISVLGRSSSLSSIGRSIDR